MGYSLVPYMLDLEQLQRSIGGKDEALLAAIIAVDPDDYDESEWDPEDDEIPLGRAVRDLVMGEPRHDASGHQYGYALERICAHLGVRLPSDCWEAIRWQVMEATGMDALLTKSGPPVPLPTIEDFPTIGHLTREQVAGLAVSLKDGPLKSAAPAGQKPARSLGSAILGLVTSRVTQRPPMRDEDVRELLDEYEDWLRTAADRSRALVFFYY